METIHIFRQDCKIMIEDDSRTRVDRCLDPNSGHRMEVHYSVDNLWKEIQYEVNYNRVGHVPNRIVKSISFPWCFITDPVFESLVTRICDDKWIKETVECIDVTWNNIGVASLPSILKLLTQCPKLQYICLGGSKLADKQVKQITNFLSKELVSVDSFKIADLMRRIVFLRQGHLMRSVTTQEPYAKLQREGLLSADWFDRQVSGYNLVNSNRDDRLASDTPYFSTEDMITALKLSLDDTSRHQKA